MEARRTHIFHPTDLSVASREAFHHALRIALAQRAKLTVMHVDAGTEAEWSDLPGVRHTLAQWGLLPSEGEEKLLHELGLGVRKVIAKGSDPVRTCLEYMDRHPADLVVLATGKHEGRMAWLDQRISEPMARQSGVPTLFVPHNCRRFVNSDTGDIRIRRLLLPVVNDPNPAKALELTSELLATLGIPECVATLFHVGSAGTMPALRHPGHVGINWEERCATGSVVEAILQQVRTSEADLLVLTTKGHDGFLDALRGDNTEQVLRHAGIPLLAVPH